MKNKSQVSGVKTEHPAAPRVAPLPHSEPEAFQGLKAVGINEPRNGPSARQLAETKKDPSSCLISQPPRFFASLRMT